jgi:hypothetical protein
MHTKSKDPTNDVVITYKMLQLVKLRALQELYVEKSQQQWWLKELVVVMDVYRQQKISTKNLEI